MYIELITTAVAMQRDMARAYSALGRTQEIGVYFLVLNSATKSFFERLSPPLPCNELHATFLEYLRTGVEALREELEAGEPRNSETSRQFVTASQAFSDALGSLSKTK